ncbi:MAG: Fe-S cluster assembly protein SufD [Candidatus Dormibacteraeota bacterium]|uniref:Fe-S cluster assembly protein SufD n=1 Tax=Candidatus Amunia macphersoniae TaxID=3127014 RepID=A0A934KJA0_9BACT|nr:Fe-S cluster assembly protein SufD [Candidatus Dormibacteraeota bacterium]
MITGAGTVTAGAPAFAAAVEARIESASGWLRDRRQAAWDAFTAMPMPSSQRDEDWRRTDTSKLRLSSFHVGDPVDEPLIEAIRARRNQAAADGALVVDTAPQTRIEHSDGLAAAGILVTSLDEAVLSHPELVQRALASVGVAESPFVALWNAIWQGGAFVYVPRSVDAAVPVWVAHSAAGDHSATFPATVVLLEDNSSLTLIDDYLGAVSTDEMFSDAVTIASVGRDARLDHHVLQQWGEATWHMALHRTVLAPNARLRMFGATLGSRLQKAYWEVLLDGAGAEAEISGVAFGDATQHLDHQSLQAHRAPQTSSRLKLKVAVRDRARSVYSGLIDVDREAQQTDAYVQNRNLILSHGATADSVPRLEIRANDVRCGHGATAGHIDDDHRFYLMARGVTEEDADRLIVRGFLDDALADCPHQGVAELIGGLLDHELEGDAQAGIEPVQA